MTQDVILPSASLAAAKRRLEIAREEAQSRHEADKVNTCKHTTFVLPSFF